jgi:hypothetical protein
VFQSRPKYYSSAVENSLVLGLVGFGTCVYRDGHYLAVAGCFGLVGFRYAVVGDGLDIIGTLGGA